MILPVCLQWPDGPGLVAGTRSLGPASESIPAIRRRLCEAKRYGSALSHPMALWFGFVASNGI